VADFEAFLVPVDHDDAVGGGDLSSNIKSNQINQSFVTPKAQAKSKSTKSTANEF